MDGSKRHVRTSTEVFHRSRLSLPVTS
jgi:hypothetical protein